MYTEVSHPRSIHLVLNNYSNISLNSYIHMKDTHLNLKNNKKLTKHYITRL